MREGVLDEASVHSDLEGCYLRFLSSCFSPPRIAVNSICQLAAVSSKGGTTEVRCSVAARVMASFICAAVASGNSDHNSAIAPVTKGTAALVPRSVKDRPSGPRLMMPSPGALKPRLPVELARFDWL